MQFKREKRRDALFTLPACSLLFSFLLPNPLSLSPPPLHLLEARVVVVVVVLVVRFFGGSTRAKRRRRKRKKKKKKNAFSFSLALRRL